MKSLDFIWAKNLYLNKLKVEFIYNTPLALMMFEFIDRLHFRKPQFLSREYYYVKVPYSFGSTILIPKVDVFWDMGRTMNKKTHKYFGGID